MITQVRSYKDQEFEPRRAGDLGLELRSAGRLHVDSESSAGQRSWNVIHHSADQETLLRPYFCLPSPCLCPCAGSQGSPKVCRTPGQWFSTCYVRRNDLESFPNMESCCLP